MADDTVLEIFRHQRRLIAGGSEPFATRRVSIGARLVISTLAAWERDQESGRNSPSPAYFAQELTELVVAVLGRSVVVETAESDERLGARSGVATPV